MFPADSNGNLGLTANEGDDASILPPGDYIFTILGTGLNGQTATSTFTWTLSATGPCDMVMCPAITEYSYTIDTPKEEIDFSSLTVAECPLDIL